MGRHARLLASVTLTLAVAALTATTHRGPDTATQPGCRGPEAEHVFADDSESPEAMS
jgi:hypothetical protein